MSHYPKPFFDRRRKMIFVTQNNYTQCLNPNLHGCYLQRAHKQTRTRKNQTYGRAQSPPPLSPAPNAQSARAHPATPLHTPRGITRRFRRRSGG
eukprot:10810800-Karenia_brevis.AAC.1